MAVHLGARIGAMAGPGEVLTSRTVRDLVRRIRAHLRRPGALTHSKVCPKTRRFIAFGDRHPTLGEFPPTGPCHHADRRKRRSVPQINYRTTDSEYAAVYW